ncbi:MAG: hypothetical protein K9M54_03835 [Kiritimatiellales bacterium]|nr:hypothetical protein [Kiritimatiellales bacterium]MCF7864359.1 hypothetical protein [Kiritimatiellales bacterium]
MMRVLMFWITSLFVTGVHAAVSASDATCVVTLDASRAIRPVSRYLTGVNLSYYNDLDTLWADKRIPGYLKQIKAGFLRYPGGEETSRFHWEQPGIRGYRDAWNTNGLKGQVWSEKDLQINDSNYMDTLEYLKWCDWIGSEPLLGVNISSGIVLDRLADSLAEIDRWYTYCLKHGYKVKYWSVDNETWHREPSTYIHMDMQTYADAVKKVSKLLKSRDPNVQIICSPIDVIHADQMPKFLALCGEDIDVIDMHWYWNWARATFETWMAHTPMTTDNQWMTTGKTYTDFIREFYDLTKKLGLSRIKLAFNEWNAGPSPKGEVMSAFVHTLISAEMMMQFTEGGLFSACMWPLVWTDDRDVVLQQIADGTYKPDLFYNRSIIDQKPPHGPLPALESFTMFSRMLGGTVVEATCDQSKIPVLAVRQSDTVLVYVLNKTGAESTIKIRMPDATVYTSAEYQVLSSTNVYSDAYTLDKGSCRMGADGVEYVSPKDSFTLLMLKK